VRYACCEIATCIPSSDWTTTGTASAAGSGAYSTSFDAGATFTNNDPVDDGNGATLSGAASGSGSDWCPGPTDLYNRKGGGENPTE